MKPDGETMETKEPIDVAAAAESSSSQNVREQTPSQQEEAASDAAHRDAPKANGKSVAADSKVKPKVVTNKTQPAVKSAGVSGSHSRPAPTTKRTGNYVKSNTPTAAVSKTTAAKSSLAAGAVPKKPMGTTGVSSTMKNQTRMPDRKPVGQARTTSVAPSTVSNGTRPTSVNTAKKRLGADSVAARPKTTGTMNRQTASAPPKPSTSTTAKAGSAANLKTTRPATGTLTSRTASTSSRPTTATTKTSVSAAAKTAASRLTTASSTGWTSAAQLPKTITAKKDISRPPSAAVTKKSTTATSQATRKPEPSKPTAKINSASKWSTTTTTTTTTTKAADPIASKSKTHQPTKSVPAKKPITTARFSPHTKPPFGQNSPASLANKAGSYTPSQARCGPRPTQAVSPFTATKSAIERNTSTSAVEAQTTASAAGMTAEGQVEPLLPSTNASSSATEEVPPLVLAQDAALGSGPEEMAQNLAAASCSPQIPVKAALTPTPSLQERLESTEVTQQRMAGADEPRLSPVAPPPVFAEEPGQTLSTCKVPPNTVNVVPLMASSSNLNEEDDEEEREGSQQVSVSEMSGTTQPTEESRPGSGGPVGGSAWRAGGALLSELDSEDVSGSHQGASELSAPGVLEGTESMDDLGDGSLKGAMEMEGASAGSPDFEKVPDIPANDFDEDEDEDDGDRVCDMDVGSEWADEPQRPRHDNDVDEDEEEDEDVEMASEGVTESGLESYGNADEDDFVEDERLDNLNRVAQPPPPPPLLPSAPAAQWDQPNPFADPWAEHHNHPEQVFERVSLPIQVKGATAASPTKDPWQADSETKTWLELGSGLPASENNEVPRCSSVTNEPQNVKTQTYMEESDPASTQTQVPAPLAAPAMSLNSGNNTPEDLGDASQAAAVPSQPDPDHQGLGIHTKTGNEEEVLTEELRADEVLKGPGNATISNPSSSSSATEDEASDTEGEAQLEESLESPFVTNVTFDSQPAPQRCLSTVEEGEECELESEVGAGEDATPPSATSLASYGFDTTTTASNSNAQSTGESCVKSPGIFSLEELPEESKEPCVIPQPHVQPCPAEQRYIECGKLDEESAERGVEMAGPEEASDPSAQQPEENPDDNQPPYYSAICEKTENSFPGFTALLHPHRRDHAAYPRTYCDIIKPHSTAVTPPKLTCADLPPRHLGQQALSPQLRRLEQHQRQLLELQQRREQQNRPLEEAEQERKRREEEEQRRKKEEAEEEIKRNKEELQRKMQEEAEEEELKQRKHLELQLQQQQDELMKWQPELQQTVLLSPSSGLCTIYEALENSDEEEVAAEEKGIRELKPKASKVNCETTTSDVDKHQDPSPSAEVLPAVPDVPVTEDKQTQDGERSSPASPEPLPLDLDWGKKVDIVQQLINQTLLLNRDSCSSLLVLPGGAGGTLSPLESSLWPSMLPPLTPPSATVTSVSSFSPEATGSSPQGEWTVVELETHH
ncbi:platelet binding protein GspB [Antennarius striatus]|uniref:platelet binding protein GspB n=1 Tax=Antennarius striatus TaxID=241820 RepID=UPI0035AE92A7